MIARRYACGFSLSNASQTVSLSAAFFACRSRKRRFRCVLRSVRWLPFLPVNKPDGKAIFAFPPAANPFQDAGSDRSVYDLPNLILGRASKAHVP
jgi:hypothetical protein